MLQNKFDLAQLCGCGVPGRIAWLSALLERRGADSTREINARFEQLTESSRTAIRDRHLQPTKAPAPDTGRSQATDRASRTDWLGTTGLTLLESVAERTYVRRFELPPQALAGITRFGVERAARPQTGESSGHIGNLPPRLAEPKNELGQLKSAFLVRARRAAIPSQ